MKFVHTLKRLKPLPCDNILLYGKVRVDNSAFCTFDSLAQDGDSVNCFFLIPGTTA